MKELPETVGCYYCLETFKSSTIEHWTDRGHTAICPMCYIDAVTSITDPEELKVMHKSSFQTYVGFNGMLVERNE